MTVEIQKDMMLAGANAVASTMNDVAKLGLSHDAMMILLAARVYTAMVDAESDSYDGQMFSIGEGGTIQ